MTTQQRDGVLERNPRDKQPNLKCLQKVRSFLVKPYVCSKDFSVDAVILFKSTC